MTGYFIVIGLATWGFTICWVLCLCKIVSYNEIQEENEGEDGIDE